ncbi:fimbrial biogenesis chaperone [Mesonia maritima]|uniref:P pilus assembly chaperone PapD n=1 Tax=Mesonia maritima TaxID=1793873 RepID=A0ABU1K4D6_9FLAO|nr:hypothetical protein [Mesonia maritima]MDR6300480.1 P pilus assembly chaperone PapD [Mesonia maritima]
MKKAIGLLVLLLFSVTSTVFAQAGIAVTPGRVYYNLDQGAEGSQVIKVTNPTNTELEIGVSFSDWNYLPSGSNNIKEAGTLENSCTDWLQILPDTYFVLEAGETKNVEVAMKVPADVDKTLPVRTSMIFFTQLNPGKAQDQEGASIQVTVRMGVKIYHSFNTQSSSELEIVDFKNYKDEQENKIVQINVKNSGDIWTSGTVEWEIFNKNTGKTQTLAKKEFHTLPNDLREIKQILPEDLKSGDYTISAILTYGDSDTINIAELDFSL